MLFYYNDQNYYAIGLDFSFMYFFDPALQAKYLDLTTGKLEENLSREIAENFKAEYILLEKNTHTKLNENLKKDLGVLLVYEDKNFIVYQIIY